MACGWRSAHDAEWSCGCPERDDGRRPGGVITGLPLAFIGGRLLESQLFSLSPHDARTIGVAVCIILSVVAIAGALPAFRARRASIQ